MPSKAQRAASRQARLSRRRKRGKSAPQAFQAGPVRPSANGDAAVGVARRSAGATRSVSEQTSAGAARATTSAAARPRRRIASPGVSNVSRYLGRELRQIGAITTLIAVILVGLTFVLG